MSFSKSHFFGNNGRPLTPVQHQEEANKAFRRDREKYFGRPDAPAAPPPPVIEDADARRQDEGDRIRLRRGRASSVLAGGASRPVTAGKYTLGS